MELSPWILLASIALPLMTGWSALRLAGDDVSDRLATLGKAWVLGYFFIALELILWMALNLPLDFRFLVVSLLFAITAVVASRRPSLLPSKSRYPARSRFDAEKGVYYLAVAVTLLHVLACILQSLDRPIITGDEATIWSGKAKVMFVTGTFGDPFREALSSSWVRHVAYPLLDPSMQVVMSVFGGRLLHFDARLPLQATVIALMILTASMLARRVRPSLAALLLLAVAFVPMIRKATLSADADALVALSLLASIDALDRTRSSSKSFDWLRLGLFLSILPWTKNEGRLLLGLMLLSTAVMALPRIRRKDVAVRSFVLAVSIPLASLLIVIAFNTLHGFSTDVIEGDPHGRSLITRIIEQAWERGPYTISWILRHAILDLSVHHGLLLLFLLGAVFFPRIAFGRLLAETITILFALIGLILVYVGSYHDLEWHLSTSVERVTFHVLPAATVWLASLTAVLFPTLGAIHDRPHAATPL